jgi:hypothetical protein
MLSISHLDLLENYYWCNLMESIAPPQLENGKVCNAFKIMKNMNGRNQDVLHRDLK